MSAISETYNIDCLQYMRTLPDNCFDLVIADPPYGIAADARQQNRAGKRHGNAAAASRDYGSASSWDLQAPAQEVFDEIFRVSRHQVIFGANHFISRMPYDASCWLVWDKDNGNNGYADCELAWTSFPTAVRKYRYTWHGMIQEDMKHKEQRIHPTQKPVALYRWLIATYLPKIGGGKIFDPFLGSGSSQKPYVLREENPRVMGVVVVAKGGGDVKIKREITDAVKALCGIGANNIKVFERK